MESADTRAARVRTRAPTIVAVLALLLGLASLGALLLPSILLSDAARTLPGTGPELAAVKHEQMLQFVPPGATRTQSWAFPAMRGQLGGQDSKTDAGANLKIDGDRGAALRAFIEPARQDGWNLESVRCSRQANESTITFAKSTGSYQLTLEVTTDVLPDFIRSTVTVDGSGGSGIAPGTQPASVAGILDTGISRTDPDCLASRRPDPAAPVAVAWTGDHLCAILAKAWPEATVEPEGEYCWAHLASGGLSVQAIASVDPYAYEENRLSLAGDDHRFAMVNGGFWVARDDGVALVAVPIGGGPPAPEDVTLQLAQAAQHAAAP